MKFKLVNRDKILKIPQKISKKCLMQIRQSRYVDLLFM